MFSGRHNACESCNINVMKGAKNKMYENLNRYEDIINLPHPTSSKHPPMSLYDRAAQFSPFAALTGHEAAIMETARLTDCEMELEEDAKEKINEMLQMIREHMGEDLEVTVTYFVPDEKKDGGKYISHTGIVTKINAYERTLVMQDGLVISIEQIKNISYCLIP